MNLKELIKEKQKKNKKEFGETYYNYKPLKDFEKGSIDYLSPEGKIIKSRGKVDLLYINYFKKIVKQKINFTLGKSIVYDDGFDKYGFNLNFILDELCHYSSLESVSWLYTYINKSNDLDWAIVRTQEIIPIYDLNNRYIEKIIRFWEDEDKDSNKIFGEIWTVEGMQEFVIDGENISISAIKPHFLEKIGYKDTEKIINPKNYGFIPFIPLWNNREKDNDLKDIKNLIDAYNSICTGFIANVFDFQEALLKLKGFAGNSLDNFLSQLRKYKAIPIPKDGDVEYMKIDIPVEARKELLDILKAAIYFISESVNPSDLLGGGNITNVVIKAKFFDLESKCNNFQNQIKLFVYHLSQIFMSYYNDTLDYDIKFNNTSLINVSESINDIINLIPALNYGIVSKRTLIENNPLINDYEIELKEIEKDGINDYVD
jgi:SPP1 family phage portal protein